MRPSRIWLVAKKDLAEFRTNKYVMFSLVLMPLLMALVLPTHLSHAVHHVLRSDRAA